MDTKPTPPFQLMSEIRPANVTLLVFSKRRVWAVTYRGDKRPVVRELRRAR